MSRIHVPYDILVALVSLGGILRKAADAFLRPHALTHSQFHTLRVLRDRAPGGSSQVELCRLVLVRAANMTGLVRRLERRGLIARAADPADERAWLVSITRKGRGLLRRVEPEHFDRIRRLLRNCPERELRHLTHRLHETQAALLGRIPPTSRRAFAPGDNPGETAPC